MGFYNIIFGENPDANTLLKHLGVDKAYFHRYRDCWADEEKGEIVVVTRNGGGNRDCWEYDPNAECKCPGCFMNYHVHKHEKYKYDEDDDFDSTYAYIHYTI